MTTVVATVALAWSTDYSVPTTQYPTLASAVNAANGTGGNVIVTGNLSNQQSVTVTNYLVEIKSNNTTPKVITFADNALDGIRMNTGCILMYLDISAPQGGNCFSVRSGGAGIYNCTFRSKVHADQDQAFNCIIDGGASATIRESVFFDKRRGIDATNSPSLYIHSCQFYNWEYGINTSGTVSSNSSQYFTNNYFNINRSHRPVPTYCIRANLTNSPSMLIKITGLKYYMNSNPYIGTAIQLDGSTGGAAIVQDCEFICCTRYIEGSMPKTVTNCDNRHCQ
jgi:hypothetical protein